MGNKAFPVQLSITWQLSIVLLGMSYKEDNMVVSQILARRFLPPMGSHKEESAKTHKQSRKAPLKEQK